MGSGYVRNGEPNDVGSLSIGKTKERKLSAKQTLLEKMYYLACGIPFFLV